MAEASQVDIGTRRGITPQTDEDLYKLLDSPHPTYSEWQSKWEIYRDVIGDVDVNKGKYLPRNTIEESNQYKYRIEISEFLPETPLAMQRLVGALYREKPKRDLKDPRLKEWVEDMDLMGTGINSWMERVMLWLIGYGSTRILANVRYPEIRPERPLTRAEEIAAGVRPYAVLYTPLAVIDWDADQFGSLKAIRIKETATRKVDPFEPTSPRVEITRFVHYDTQFVQWWEFSGGPGKNDKLRLAGSGGDVHALGFVPLVVRYWPKRLKTMVGSSYVRYMALADVQKFRSESDRDYDAYLHAHPVMKLWTNSEISELGINTSNFMKLQPGGAGVEREDADYMNAPQAALNALRDVIQDKAETIRRHSNMDPLGQIQPGGSIFQASGVSRAWSFGMSEARILSDLADAAVEIEHAVMEAFLQLVASPEERASKNPLFKGEIQYPEEFDLSSTDELLQQTTQIGQTINSPTLLRILHKRIAASKVGDVSQKVVQEIYDEIDSNPLINTPVGQPKSPLEFPQFSIPSSEDAIPEESEGEAEEEAEEEESERATSGRNARRRGRRRTRSA